MFVNQRGRAFAKKFSSLKNIGRSRFSAKCYSDDTVQSIDKTDVPFTLAYGNGNCHSLNFSDFARDGSNIFANAPQTYDAVTAVGYAFHYLFEEKGGEYVDRDVLYQTFLDHSTIKFAGATGEIAFSPGFPQYPYTYRGDVDVGQTYMIYNFDTTKMSYGRFGNAGYHAEGFKVIGRFVSNSANKTLFYLRIFH